MNLNHCCFLDFEIFSYYCFVWLSVVMERDSTEIERTVVKFLSAVRTVTTKKTRRFFFLDSHKDKAKKGLFLFIFSVYLVLIFQDRVGFRSYVKLQLADQKKYYNWSGKKETNVIGRFVCFSSKILRSWHWGILHTAYCIPTWLFLNVVLD